MLSRLRAGAGTDHGRRLRPAQPGHFAGADVGQTRLLWGDLGPPRDQELADLGAVIHTSTLRRIPFSLGCTVDTRLDRDSLTAFLGGLLGTGTFDTPS